MKKHNRPKVGTVPKRKTVKNVLLFLFSPIEVALAGQAAQAGHTLRGDHLTAVAHVNRMAAGPQGQRRSDVMAGGSPASPSSHHAGLEALLFLAAKDAAQGGFEAFLFGGGRSSGGRSFLGGQLGDMQRILNNKKEVYKGTV
jgi:hypothetical protein